MIQVRELPADIGGYQHIENGPLQEWDIWVYAGKPQSFIIWPSPFINVEHANETGEGRHIYRKIPVPSCKDDKALWGEVEKAGFDAPTLPCTFIPQGDKERKNAPLYRGLLGYFPAALFAVAAHSQASDRKHNPDAKDGPTWARHKSSDHADCIVRHLIDAGNGKTEEEIYHLTAIAWRSLAMLQEALEKRGARPGVSSRF